jgi:hypothetical protein
MFVLFFVLVTLVASVLLGIGMATDYKLLFGVGSILFTVAFIIGLNPARRNGHTTH